MKFSDDDLNLHYFHCHRDRLAKIEPLFEYIETPYDEKSAKCFLCSEEDISDLNGHLSNVHEDFCNVNKYSGCEFCNVTSEKLYFKHFLDLKSHKNR